MKRTFLYSRFSDWTGMHRQILRWLLSFFMFLSVLFTVQGNEDSLASRLSVRSGLSCGVGFSKLYLNDAILPRYITSEYLKFGYDFCVYAGAMVVVDPGFTAPLEFEFDPSFSKYSYGNLKGQYTDTIFASADIDMEALRFPVSVRYSFNSKHSFKPFVKVGGAFAFFIDTEAYFNSKVATQHRWDQFESHQFNYSKYQNSVLLGAGLEVDYFLADFTIELLVEKGDGLYEAKYGSHFLKTSNTTSFSLQLGVLF